MNNLHEVYENNYVSVENYNAEDNKPFKFAVCVEVIDLYSACGDPGFLISVDAAKLPKYLSVKQRKDIANSMCVSVKEITVTDVNSYGLHAPLDSYTVLNEDEVITKLNEIDKQLPVYGMMCGFYFDREVNRIGNNGWDFLIGKIG